MDNNLFVQAGSLLQGVRKFNKDVLGANQDAPSITTDPNGQRRFNPGSLSAISVGSVQKAPSFAKSVLQVVNTKTNAQHFYRIPESLFVHFKDMVDSTGKGVAGIANKAGEIFHLTAKSPEQMAARGFVDKGVANLSQIPTKVSTHTRSGVQVKDYVR